MPKGYYELITAPSEEPVTVAEAIAAGRIGGDVDEDLVTSLLLAAKEKVKQDTGRQLMPAIWYLYLDGFPPGREPIQITKLPITTAENLSVSYCAPDDEGVSSQVDDPFVVIATDTPARIYPPIDEMWPTVRAGFPNPVIVQFQAGYGGEEGDAAAVPAPLKQAIILLVSRWYESPDAVGGVPTEFQSRYDALISTYRVMEYA